MKKLLLAAILAAFPACAQLAQPVSIVTSAPAGACTNGAALQYDRSAGQGILYGCKNGTWTAIGSAPGGVGVDYYGVFSGLIAANTVTNGLAIVTDCATVACVAGSGSLKVMLRDTGSAWETALNFSEFSGSYVPDMAPNAQTGTTYTILTGDKGKLVSLSNASSVAVTLPQATGSFASGWWTLVKNIGAGTVTITPTTSTVNGASTLTLATGEFAILRSDGTNYEAIGNHLVAGTNVTITAGRSGPTINSTASGGGVNTGTSGCFAYYPSAGSTVDDVQSTVCRVGWNSPSIEFYDSSSTLMYSINTTTGVATSFGTASETILTDLGADPSAPASGKTSFYSKGGKLKFIPNGGVATSLSDGSRGISFSFGDPAGSALSSGSTTTAYVTVPFACTITAWNITVDAGTATVKFWKKATGTAIPTSSDSINTSGVAISTGTAVHSTTVSDFTSTVVAKNDILAANISAVSTAKFLNATLECVQ